MIPYPIRYIPHYRKVSFFNWLKLWAINLRCSFWRNIFQPPPAVRVEYEAVHPGEPGYEDAPFALTAIWHPEAIKLLNAGKPLKQ